MPSLPYDNRNFSRGFNTASSATLLDDVPGSPRGRDVLNVQGTVAGALTKRNGLLTAYSPAVVLNSLFVSGAVKTTGASNDPGTMIGAGGTSLYAFTSGSSLGAIKTGLTSGLRWEFMSMPVVGGQGPLFGMNGTDTPQRWDGIAGTSSDWTNVSGAVHVPNGTMLVQWQNQAFVAGTTTTPTGMTAAPDPQSRLYWSAIGDPTSWDQTSLTGAGFVDFDPQDGEPITAIGVVGPYLMVFKRGKTWVLIQPGATGVTSTQVRQLSNSIGCPAHRSLASGPNGTYFLSSERIYLTNGSRLTPMSDTIQPTVNLNFDRPAAAGVVYDNHYYLSIDTNNDATNDTTLDWDETLQSWWKHSFGSNQFAIWDLESVAAADRPFLYSAKSTAAIIDRCFVGSVYQDNGTNYQWYWKGPWQSPSFVRRRFVPTTFYRKRLRQIRLEGSGTVDYSIAYNLDPTQTAISSDVFQGSSLQTEATLFSLGVSRAFSQVFSATSSTAAELDAYTMFVTDRRDRMVS